MLNLGGGSYLIYWFDRSLIISHLMRRTALVAAIFLGLENLPGIWSIVRSWICGLSSIRLWARAHPFKAALEAVFPLLPSFAVFSMTAFLLAICLAPPDSSGEGRKHPALRVSAFAVILVGVLTLAEYGYAMATNFKLALLFLLPSAIRLATLDTLVSFFVALHNANRKPAQTILGLRGKA
ncbi:MAG: hypothetical protein ACM3NO_02785 [Deltaproteobacteria bacterium]